MPRRKAENSIQATVLGGLEYAVDVLNGSVPDHQDKLRWLVTEWESAARNLMKMFTKHFEVGQRVRSALAPYVDITADGDARMLLLLPYQVIGASPNQDPDVAYEIFAMLVLDARRQYLGGPCDRCGRYYIKKRLDQKRYCGRRCAHLASAVRSTSKRLEREHKDKLDRAKSAVVQWRKTVTRLDWKRWVSRKEPDITPKFLTRAVRKGELNEPMHR